MEVKKITVYRIDLIPNTGREEYILNESFFDPESGLIIQETKYTPDGQVEDASKREYDRAGNVTLLEVTDADGSLLEKRTFEYDSFGRLTIEYVHYADESADRKVSTFDENGHLIKRELFDEDNDLETVEVFEYRGENLTREAEFNSDGVLLKERLLKYSEKGLIVKETIFDNEDGHSLRKVFSYDKDNWLEEVTTFDQEEKALERVTYSYNENGKPQIITEETRSFKNTTTIGYNHNGDVIFEEEIDHNGQILRTVERELNGDGQLTLTRVLTRNLAYGITRSYIMRYEYSIKS